MFSHSPWLSQYFEMTLYLSVPKFQPNWNMHMCAMVILVFSHVTYSWLLIGQNSLASQCVISTQRIYNLFKMPIPQQPIMLDIIFWQKADDM